MRSQAISIDLMLSITVFIIALTMLLLFIYSSSYVYNSDSIAFFSTNELLKDNKIASVVSSLMFSPGTPSNWESLSCNQIISLGLLNSSNNQISFFKLKSFLNLGYKCVDQKLGLNNFGVKLSYLNGSNFNISGNYQFWNTSGTGTQVYAYIYPNSTLIEISLFIK